MPISIIANRSAQYAQSAMQTQNTAITLSTRKVSSGLRVMDASQDAGALAIGTSLKIENASLASAANNVTSAMSMLQIADGAMSQVSDILNRMSTLATQASSGQLDDAARALVDAEYQALKSEVNRLVNVTSFNGVKMLAGSSNVAVTAGSSLSAAGISSVASTESSVADASYRVSYNPTTESLTLTQVNGATTANQTFDLTQLLDTVAGEGKNLSGSQQLGVSFSQFGVTVTLDSHFNRATAIDPTATTVAADAALTVATPATTVPGANMSLETVAGLNALVGGYSTTTGALTLPLVSDGTNVHLGAVAGISYAVNGGAVGASGADSADLNAGANSVDVYVDLPTGGRQLVGTLTTGAIATSGATTTNVTMNVGKGLMFVDNTDTTEATAATHLVYKVGSGIVVGQDLIDVTIPALNLTALGLTDSNVGTKTDANTAIDTLKAAMAVLNTARSEVGAQQSRMEQISSNLAIVQENNESARSALMDVDVSEEITNLTNSQVLMQASIAMLKQANSMPSMLLDLLK
jgi:flagellin